MGASERQRTQSQVYAHSRSLARRIPVGLSHLFQPQDALTLLLYAASHLRWCRVTSKGHPRETGDLPASCVVGVRALRDGYER